MVGEIEVLKVLADWGWAAAGSGMAIAGTMVIGRISALEKRIETRAPNEDLKILSAKHDTLSSEMHRLFRDQNDMITGRLDQVMIALMPPKP